MSRQSLRIPVSKIQADVDARVVEYLLARGRDSLAILHLNLSDKFGKATKCVFA